MICNILGMLEMKLRQFNGSFLRTIDTEGEVNNSYLALVKLMLN